MGYEIAGGIGMKMAQPDRDVIVMVGDGSYLMMNSEIATSVMLGIKITVVVLDNRGFGCINRLQKATGGARFNNLLVDAQHETMPEIDFAHACEEHGRDRREGRLGRRTGDGARGRRKVNDRTTVLVIDTDPMIIDGSRRPLVGCGGAGGLEPQGGAARHARPMKRRARCSVWGINICRHPGESRDPTHRVTSIPSAVPAEPWVPAFAGVTKTARRLINEGA